MTVGGALRAALGDFYHHSWRLVILNTLLSSGVLTLVYAGSYAPVASLPVVVAIAILVGPLGAALMHCAVTLAQTEDLTLREALAGLRLHWLRGFELAALVAAGIAVGVIAIGFYARLGAAAWPLAILAFYLLGLFGILQLSLWPLAVFERERPLRAVVTHAAIALLRRPLGWVGLGVALLLVNMVALVAGVLPFLTMSIAYSCLAAAHFALPRGPLREGASS